MNIHDDMLDAFRYALEFLTHKETKWRKIIKWFKRVYRKIWFIFNKKKILRRFYRTYILLITNDKSFRIRNVMGNLYSKEK